MAQAQLSPAAARARDRPFPLRTGRIEVRHVARPTPNVARIVFSGEDLRDLPDEEPGEIITLIWPGAGRDEPVLPAEGWKFPADCPEQHCRNYTVRSYDRSRPELTIDFVVHGDHGAASRWATAARPGQVLGFAGPRIHFITEPDAGWTLLAGDETALPAIAATLERLPAGHPTHVFVEVADETCHTTLWSAADLTLEWIHRDGEAPGRCTRLEQAVRAAELPEGDGKVWVAGESLVVRRLREHLKGERGLTIGPLQAIGYWKHRDTPADVE